MLEFLAFFVMGIKHYLDYLLRSMLKENYLGRLHNIFWFSRVSRFNNRVGG